MTISANPLVIGTLEEGMRWINQESHEFVAVDPVEQGWIRHYCELIEDANPLYYDTSYARETIWGDVVAPPGSLVIWCLPPVWAAPGWVQSEPPRVHRMVPLPGAAVIVTEVDTEFFRPVRPGDRLRYSERITGITPKTTRLGAGCFITVEQTYRRQDGAVVAQNRWSVFRYVPATKEGPQA